MFKNSYARALLLLCLTFMLTACGGSDDGSAAAEHLERADVYADQGQYRAAMIELRSALQKNPNDLTATLTLAETLTFLGLPHQAAALLEPWHNDGQGAVALTLAKAYAEQGKHLSVRETLTGYTAANEAEQTELLRLQADADRLAGNNQQALAGYQAAQMQQPDNAEIAAGLARLHIDLLNYDQALAVIDRFSAAHNSTADLQYLRGLSLYQQNQLDDATRTLTEGLALVPSSDIFLPTRRQLVSLLARTLTEQGNATQAMIYNQILNENTNVEFTRNTESAVEAIGRGDLETARTTLESLIQQNPDSQLVALLLGAVSLQQGDLEEGTALLTDNLDVELAPIPFIRLSAMAQVDQGMRDQAMSSLQRALMARPTDVDLMAMYGILALADSDPNNIEQGKIHLAKALQMDPSRSRLRLALAQYHQAQNEPEQAMGYLRAAFAQSPTDWVITEQYLTTLVASNAQAEAEQVRDRLLRDHGNEPYSLFLASLTDFQYGATTRAMNRLESLIQTSPNWHMPYLALARMQRSTGQNSAAIDTFLRAADANPADISGLQEAGQLIARQGTPEEVVDWLLETGIERPALADHAKALAAQIHIQQGRLADAQALLASAQADNPAVNRIHTDFLIAEARQAANREDWSTTRARVAEAVSRQPENPDHRLFLVRIVAAEGRTAEADQLLDDIETEFGILPNTALTRSTLLLQAQGPDTAYTSLNNYWLSSDNPTVLPELIRLANLTNQPGSDLLAETWTQRQPNNPIAWQTLGNQRLRFDNELGAARAYREALSRNADNPMVLNNLAWLVRESNTEEAIALARRAAELVPDSPAVLDTLGWVLHLGGQRTEALDVLMRAQSQAPDDAEIQAHLATVQAAQ